MRELIVASLIVGLCIAATLQCTAATIFYSGVTTNPSLALASKYVCMVKEDRCANGPSGAHVPEEQQPNTEVDLDGQR